MLQYSLAKTLAHKEKITVRQVFTKYGKHITFIKPNGRAVQFFSEPLIQVKKAKRSATEVDALPDWRPRRTQSRLQDCCAICASAERVEMHHVRSVAGVIRIFTTVGTMVPVWPRFWSAYRHPTR